MGLMLNGFFKIISRQASPGGKIQRVTLTDPLQRFNDSEYFGKFKVFRTIANGIAKQTNAMVESLLSDDRIPDWQRSDETITSLRLSDLSILCSHYLVQFALTDVRDDSAVARLETGLRAEIFDLVRLMYGDFARESSIDALTFHESLETGDLEDSQELWYLTRLLDQLIGVGQAADRGQRDAKVQKLRELFEGQRAFAYTLHSVL